MSDSAWYDRTGAAKQTNASHAKVKASSTDPGLGRVNVSAAIAAQRQRTPQMDSERELASQRKCDGLEWNLSVRFHFVRRPVSAAKAARVVSGLIAKKTVETGELSGYAKQLLKLAEDANEQLEHYVSPKAAL